MDSELTCADKENEIINSVCDSSNKNKGLKSNKLTENEKGTKLSKKGSLLDTYCNTLNESTDFVEYELTNKFRNASQKSEKKDFQNGSQVNETMMCEICKEDITSLDIHNRAIHVNKCIDKQISSDTEVTTQSSSNEVTIPSFTNENVFILECPLCFKHFSSPELRSSHIKKCGKSKGLSLQSILKALELQERHVLERISLGLPAKPVKPMKLPKNPVKKAIVEPKNKAQSDIQLAKALSLSLASSSQQDDAETDEMITSVILKPPTANQRPGKKTKKIFTPLLVLRTDEERKKLLLDKVENILTLAIDSHSSSPANETDVTKDKENIDDQELTLWHLSSKLSDKCQYYIEELLHWIKPSDVEMGTKLLHLSQIPGHEILTQLPCDYTFSTLEENNDTNSQAAKVSSITDQQSSSVLESLRSLVASSWMSDVDIHTACGTVIPAHKLILAIRCPPLKKDFDFCSEKTRACLKWEDVSFDVALQFLNFIYTGNIDVKTDMMYDLFYLANKYEVFDLQTVLHANKTDEAISKVNSKQEILNIEEEPHFPSCNGKTTENAENMICESQEDTNMDLEVVYNYLNKSLKPSQSTNSQSSVLNDAIPFKCKLEENENNDISFEPNDDERASVSNCSSKTLILSPKSSDSTSPMIDDVNDVENNTDNRSLEKAFIWDNFTLKNKDSTSPIIFDVNESENDTDNLSDNETTECIMNFSQKYVSGPSKVKSELLDLNPAESNSSDDSVKFLQSSYVANNTYCSPEKARKSTSFSPEHSEITSFSPTIKYSPVSYQDKHKEQTMPIESSNKALTNSYAESKSPSVSYSQVSDEKKYDLTLDKYNNPHTDISVDLESPVTSFSQRVLSGFRSVYQGKTLGVTDVKDDLKSLSTDSLVNKTNELSKNINSLKNENITDTYSLSGEDNEANFSLSIKSSSFPSDAFSAIKSDDDVIPMSPVRKPAPPEVLISDSDDDSKSQGDAHYKASPLHHYMNFSPNNIKPDINNPANSPRSSSKSSQEDVVFESFHYFDHEISPPNVDQLQTVNSSEYSNKKTSSSNKNNVQYSKYSTKKEEYAVRLTDNLQSSKVLKHPKKEETVTPSNNTEMQQHKFQLSDSPITPFPDYKNMMTPEIKQALKRIGVKPLPRKKALAILSHIYDETHPLIDEEINTASTSGTSDMQSDKEEKVNKSKKRKQTAKNLDKPVKKQQKESPSKEAVLASPESDESGSENPEWIGCVPEISFSQSNHDSPTKPSTDDLESIRLYIQSDEGLYHSVLNYIPLNLVEFQQNLKNNGIKISIQKLMDFLDEQCITFTCPRKEEYKKKQTARTQRFRKNMIAKLSQQAN